VTLGQIQRDFAAGKLTAKEAADATREAQEQNAGASPLALGIVVGVLVVCALCFTWWLTLMPSPTP